MKHTIIISPRVGTNGGWLSMNKIRYKGADYCITKDWIPVRRDMLKASDEPFMKLVNRGTTFTITFEDSGQQDRKNEDRKLACEIIKYHEQVITDGFKNPNMGGAPLFQYEDLAMNDERNYSTLAMILAAMNKCADMSYREKVNLMYYYGANPQVTLEDGKVGVMDHKQLAIRLYDVGSAGGVGVGLVLQRTPFGATGKTVMQHFVEDYNAGDATYALKTLILKGFIIKDGNGKALLKKDGQAILMGETLVGTNLDEAVMFLNNNPEKKKYLDKMVRQSDMVDADTLDEVRVKSDPISNSASLEKKSSEQEIRDEAKKLRIQGWYNHPIDSITPQLEGARKVWKEVENLGLQPKIDGAKKNNLKDIAKMVENEKKRLEALSVDV